MDCDKQGVPCIIFVLYLQISVNSSIHIFSTIMSKYAEWKQKEAVIKE